MTKVSSCKKLDQMGNGCENKNVKIVKTGNLQKFDPTKFKAYTASHGYYNSKVIIPLQRF